MLTQFKCPYIYELERSRVSLCKQNEKFAKSFCCTKYSLISQKEIHLRKLRILGFASCGIPYASSIFSTLMQYSDFVVHILVISRSKQTGEENSGIVTCLPSL